MYASGLNNGGTDRLLGGSDAPARGYSHGTAYSLASAGSSPAGASAGGGNRALSSTRPYAPLLEDSDDDDFMLSLRGVQPNRNANQTPTTVNNSSTSGGGGGGGGGQAGGGGNRQPSQQSAMADEFEELMSLGDARTATPKLGPLSGATATDAVGLTPPPPPFRTTFVQSEPGTPRDGLANSSGSGVIGNLRGGGGLASSGRGGLFADPYGLGNASLSIRGGYASSDGSSVEGTESDYDDYYDTSSSSEEGGAAAERVGGGGLASSPSSLALRLEVTGGRHGPTMGGRREYPVGADEARHDHLFGGSFTGPNGIAGLLAAEGAAAAAVNNRSNSNSGRPRAVSRGPTVGSSSHNASYIGGIPHRRRLKPMRVSKYLLGAVMGSGATCTVRDAIDISNNTLMRVAVKMLKKPERKLGKLHSRERAHIEAMIENEVEMLQRFHHPNVMRAFDVFTRSTRQYIAMPIAICSLQDFINIRAAEMRQRAADGFDSACVSRTQSLGGGGGNASNRNTNPQQHTPSQPSLRHLQPQQTSSGAFGGDDRFSSKVLVPARLVKDIFLQVLAGVAYLHSQRVHHNDLKPSNILLFGDGSVRISDLGCSGSTFEVGRHGTPAFVSPQVVSHLVGHENEGLVSASEPLDPAKNDAWACGVVLYQLLTGRLPYGHAGSDGYASVDGSGGDVDSFDDLGLDDDDDIIGAGSRHSSSGRRASPQQQRRQVNEFTIYHDIVFTPVDYDRVYEEGDADYETIRSPGGSFTRVPLPPPRALVGLGKGAASGRHLLMGLLNKNQNERLSVEAALRHPWLQDAIRRAPLAGPDHLPPVPNLDPLSQAPKAPGVAPKGSTAHATALKRVFDVAEIREMIEKDFRRHMQHAAEVCYIMRLELPSPLFRVPCNADTQPRLMPPARPLVPPSPDSCLYHCVNGAKFLPDSAMRYYAKKGRADSDIATLRSQQHRRVHFYLYIEGLITLCEMLARNETFAATGTTPDPERAAAGAGAGDANGASSATSAALSRADRSGRSSSSSSSKGSAESEAARSERKKRNKVKNSENSCWCC